MRVIDIAAAASGIVEHGEGDLGVYEGTIGANIQPFSATSKRRTARKQESTLQKATAAHADGKLTEK